MPKSKPKESDFNLSAAIFLSVYLLFCAWWQYKFIYPFIKAGEYNDAFNMAMGLNPLTPIAGLFIFHTSAVVLGWVMDFWVFLFGRR